LDALEAMLVRLNWGQIFSLLEKRHSHIIAALKHIELFADKVNWAIVGENGVLLASKMIKAPLPGVATSSKGLLQEESEQPTVRIIDGLTGTHIS